MVRYFSSLAEHAEGAGAMKYLSELSLNSVGDHCVWVVHSAVQLQPHTDDVCSRDNRMNIPIIYYQYNIPIMGKCPCKKDFLVLLQDLNLSCKDHVVL